MDKMLSSIIKNKKITLLLIVFIMISGIYGYFANPKQQTPDIVAPVAIITTVYPGASQDDVEKLVTRKIENEISGIEGYEDNISTSCNNVSIIVVYFKYGVNLDETFDILQEKMEEIQNEIPEECLPIEINEDVVKTSGMLITLTGEEYSFNELAFYAEQINQRLSNIDGVSTFDIYGKQDKHIVVEIDYKRLNYYDLSLNEISQIIKAQNIKIPSGNIKNNESILNIVVDSDYKSIDDIKNTIICISKNNGTVIRLKEIANIYEEYESADKRIRYLGKDAVLLAGYFEEDKNIVIIGKDVEKTIEDVKKDLPEGLEFNNIYFQPDNVSKSVNDFIINLLEGILFVIIVVFVGMGIRNAIIVSTAIPMSILSTLACMYIFGIKIHQVSIASLIVALGMLVDNAIVVSDAIQIRLNNGEDRLSACIEGVKEVATPVLTSTLTTIAAFSPLLALNSLAGDFVIALPQVVIIALISSYLVALLVSPTMAYMFFRKEEGNNKKTRLKYLFSSLLDRALKKKASFIVILLVVIIGLSSLFSRLDIIFFPKVDEDIMYIDITAEKNIEIDYTQKVVQKVEHVLSKQPEMIEYTSSVGGPLPKYYKTMGIKPNKNDVAQVLFRFDLEKGERFINNTQFNEWLQNEINITITGGKAVVKQLEYAEPSNGPINFYIRGNNIEEVYDEAEKARNILNDINGTYNVVKNASDKSYQYKINVNKIEAESRALTNYDIQNEISLAIRGREATVLRKDGNEQSIIVRTNIENIEELENLYIKSNLTDNKILLKDIADICLESSYPSVNRYDNNYAVSISGDVKQGYDRNKILTEFNEKWDKPRSIEILYDGENEAIDKYFGSLIVAGIVALFIIYLILLFQFKSCTQPLVVLITVPLSMAGTAIGLFITKQPLSFTAVLGMVSLLGIVVNNAIVLLEYINDLLKKGIGLLDACKEASSRRFRPIILSTTTTCIGLIPLAISKSELFKPLSIALMSGLLISTFLTLVVVPTVFAIVYGRNIKNK